MERLKTVQMVDIALVNMGWLGWAGHGITGLEGGVDAYAGFCCMLLSLFWKTPQNVFLQSSFFGRLCYSVA